MACYILKWPSPEDLQSKFEIAKMYREHLTSVAKDRAFEEYLQERLPGLARSP